MDTSALSPDEETRIWDFLTVVGGSQMEAQACLTEALAKGRTMGDLDTAEK